ncbi:MAG: hypothetical protein IH950_05090 [Bacteroidetes bacterium]|nr:hypothetical protein [Bacteroidota bacterium]
MKNKLNYFLFFTFIYFSFTYLGIAQSPGELDKTFGNGGRVNVGIGGYFDVVKSMALQHDGKIVVVGYGKESLVSFKGLSMARYLQNGEMDYDFGNLGVIHRVTKDLEGEANSVAIQKDDKIVVTGYSISPTTNNEEITLVRFTENGNIDKSFGNKGLIVTEISNEKDVGESVAIQNDGKIVVVGTTDHKPNADIVLIRYNKNGSLDYSFGIGGIVITDINSAMDIGKSLVIQSDGKLIVAGFTHVINKFFMTLLRYDSYGELDPTFGNSGIVITDINGRRGKMDMVMQNDGKIILVGPSEVEDSHHFTVLRFNNNGSLDKSFGNNGVTKTIIGDYSEAESVALDSNGNIVVAGTTELGNEQFVVVMYDRNGMLVPDFGSDGIVKTSFIKNSVDRAHSVVIDYYGNIIVAGETKNDYTTFGLIKLIGK